MNKHLLPTITVVMILFLSQLLLASCTQDTEDTSSTPSVAVSIGARTVSQTLAE